jgi:hypothetical protein
MKNTAGGLQIAATDLSNYIGCHHLTTLDLAVAPGERPAPEWRDSDLIVLQERGKRHEAAYLTLLEASEGIINDLRGTGDADSVAQTLAAMRRGRM